jgi:hypothetical protein
LKSLVKLTPKVRRERQELVQTLLQAKREAMRLGLIRTHHALDEATTVIGWEMAEHEREQ